MLQIAIVALPPTGEYINGVNSDDDLVKWILNRLKPSKIIKRPETADLVNLVS